MPSSKIPAGPSTDTVPRPVLGSVPCKFIIHPPIITRTDDAVGSAIFNCVNPGDIALTYDDGPYLYTDAMLDVLEAHGAKATFFITGNNNGKGAIDTTPAWSAVISRMDALGHQLASHTWSHANLDSLTEVRRRAEMVRLEMALRNIVGKFPTYMRPPYSKCVSAACMATMVNLGYHITYFDLDTDDYNNITPTLIQNAKNRFDSADFLHLSSSRSNNLGQVVSSSFLQEIISCVISSK